MCHGFQRVDIRGRLVGVGECGEFRHIRRDDVGSDAYATQTRLTITVRVKYTDSKNPANDIDQTFSAYRDFSSSVMLTDVQDELCNEISKELVDLIFNATLGNW